MQNEDLLAGLIGGGFQHAESSTLYKRPKAFKFDKGVQHPVNFFVDDGIIAARSMDKKKFDIAWVVESHFLSHNYVSYIVDNLDYCLKRFDAIITHHHSLYTLNDRIYYYPPHGYWIESPGLYKKTKLVSCICSNKLMHNGHAFRLKELAKHSDKIDLYGTGFQFIEQKELGLKDYKFSLVFENDIYRTYWTEKILDCFVTGTVPIYSGTEDIFNHFDSRGIIKYDANFELNLLNDDLYIKMLPFVQINYQLALKYSVIEDLIFDDFQLSKYYE